MWTAGWNMSDDWSTLFRLVRDGNVSHQVADDRDIESRDKRDCHDRLHRPLQYTAFTSIATDRVYQCSQGALIEIFPVKYMEETRLRIEDDAGNIVFNVIIPQNSSQNEETQDWSPVRRKPFQKQEKERERTDAVGGDVCEQVYLIYT